MPDNDEYSKGGSHVHRYSAEDHTESFEDLGESSLKEIDRHIVRWVGEPATVLHEMLSPTVHVDVHLVPPTPDRSFFTLVTSGMSDKPMNSPFKGLEYAELVACLPADWQIDQRSIFIEENYWPIRWLKSLARFPHEYNTWLWESHTIPYGDPPQPFAENTGFTGILLTVPWQFDQNFRELSVRRGKVIHFHSLMPIYTEEMQYKLDNGIEALYEKFDEERISAFIDLSRPNTCA